MDNRGQQQQDGQRHQNFHRQGGQGNRQNQNQYQQQGNRRNGGRSGGDRVPRPGEERPRKEAILDLGKYRDQEVRVKFTGGREVIGVLKGYDQLMNLVLNSVKETLRDPEDENVLLDKTRDLGTVIVRGPLLQTIAPLAGNEVISNPFIAEE